MDRSSQALLGGVVAELDRHVSEAVLPRRRERCATYLRVGQGLHRGPIGNQYREARALLNPARKPPLRQHALERGRARGRFAPDAHAPTPWSTLSEPDRNPRMSTATRAKPASSIAAFSVAKCVG